MFLYYEPLSINKNNNVFSIQILKNFVEPKKVVLKGKTIAYKSVTDKQLIDCSKNIYRNTEVIFFEEWDAKGKELYKSIIDKVRWHEVKSNSVQEGLIKKVCFSV
jgi:5S rRNA maturation endonuclease (ribonuclease M5)